METQVMETVENIVTETQVEQLALESPSSVPERSEDLPVFDMEVSEAPVEEKKVKEPASTKTKKEKKPKEEKERINGLVPKKLADCIKNIALWHPEHTLTSLMIEGLEFVKEKYGELPEHGGKLKVGRRPKVTEEKK